MPDCVDNYDDQITVTPKVATPSYSEVPKPYTMEPNGLVTEDCNAILNEDGTQLLMQVGQEHNGLQNN